LLSLTARINIAGADKDRGYGAGGTHVNDFIRVGEVDPRQSGGTQRGFRRPGSSDTFGPMTSRSIPTQHQNWWRIA